MRRSQPKGSHWLKWAGRKPENKYPWSIPGYWFRAGARAMVALFRAQGAAIPRNVDDTIQDIWISHMERCEPGLVKQWKSE